MILAFSGLAEWCIFTPAILNMKGLLAGPFLALVYCVLLGILNCHVSHWNREVRNLEKIAKYMGFLV